MSHPVQIPADVARDDVLIGRLTARQLAGLGVTAAVVYLLWRLLGPEQLGWFVLAAAPVALLGIAVVFGRRDGMGLDVLALAAFRQWSALRVLPRYPRPAPSPAPPTAPHTAVPVGDRRRGGARLRSRRPIRVGAVVGGVYAVGSDGLGVLDLGADGSAVVCAVAPVNLSLRSPREQDAVVAGFARWLHSLSAPVQILTRTQPLDLSGPIQHLHQAAPHLGNTALAAAARGHAAHLEVMDQHAELLHHEFLIVFRHPSPLPSPQTSRSRRRAQGSAAGAAVAVEALRRRAGEACALLGSLGLRVTPLSAAQAGHVLERATAPATVAPATVVPHRTRPVRATRSHHEDEPGLAEAVTEELPIIGRERERGAGFDPGPVLIRSRRVGLGGVWSATLVVTGYPREVTGAGWLAPLTGHPGLVDVSLHITPVDPTVAAGQLRRQLARLESARRSTATHDRLPDPDIDAAAEDAHVLAERVARGETKLFSITLTVTVTAPTEEELDAELAAVRALLSSLLITAHPATGRAWHAWRTGLPLGCDLIDTGRILDTTALAASFPFASPDLPPPHADTSGAADGGGTGDQRGAAGGEVLYGYNLASSSLVFWDRWRRDNYNSIILGASGSGKSYLAKLELLRSLYAGVAVQVIDPEDEYVRLAHAVDATVVRVGAPGVRINPLDLDIHTDHHGRRSAAPDALARRRLALHAFLSLALTTTDDGPTGPGTAGGQLSAAERAIVDEAITATYTRAGITDDATTWTRPAPLLRDLYTVLTTAPQPRSEPEPEADGRIFRALNPDLYPPGHDQPRVGASDTTTTDDPDPDPDPDHDQDDDNIESENVATHPMLPGKQSAYRDDRRAADHHAGEHGAGENRVRHLPGFGDDGSARELAQDLARRLRPFVDGAFAGLFDGPTTHPATGRHLVVWSLRELPEQLRSLATLLVLDTIWRTVTHPHDRRRRLVVVDEAWLLLQHPAGARFLLRAAKAGRKHWCGLVVATQDTADVLATDLGRAVITNSATQILLRQAPQAIDQISRVFGLSAGERALLLTAERGEGLLTGGEHRAGFAALASPQEDRVITTDPAQLEPTTDDSWIDLDPTPPSSAPIGAGPFSSATWHAAAAAPRVWERAW